MTAYELAKEWLRYAQSDLNTACSRAEAKCSFRQCLKLWIMGSGWGGQAGDHSRIHLNIAVKFLCSCEGEKRKELKPPAFCVAFTIPAEHGDSYLRALRQVENLKNPPGKGGEETREAG